MEGDSTVVLPAEVLVAADVPDEDHDQLIDDLRSLGLDPTARRALRRRGISDIPPWVVFIALPLQPFLNALIENLAGDAYQRLKASIVRVFRHRHELGTEAGARVVVLADTVTGVQVVLEPDLPAKSYQQLLRFDLSTITRGPVRYDRGEGRWRCELDEPVRPSTR